MAFPDPVKTWSVGETLTAANFNAQIRDAFLAVPHLIVRKPSDQSSSSTTLADDTALVFAVAANEVWYWRQVVLYDTATTTDMQVAWTFPASATFNATGVNAGSGAGTIEFQNYFDTSSPTTTQAINGFGAGTNAIWVVEGIYVGAGTAGNVQFRWAPNAAANCTVRANSCIFGMKLA